MGARRLWAPAPPRFRVIKPWGGGGCVRPALAPGREALWRESPAALSRLRSTPIRIELSRGRTAGGQRAPEAGNARLGRQEPPGYLGLNGRSCRQRPAAQPRSGNCKIAETICNPPGKNNFATIAEVIVFLSTAIFNLPYFSCRSCHKRGIHQQLQ